MPGRGKRRFGAERDLVMSENERQIDLVARISVGWPEGKFLGLAESCTGGMVGAAITALPGVSRWFRGSVVAYHNQLKTDVLGVSEQVLQQYGAVSEECARAMSDGVRLALATQVGLAVTGIAGPEGTSAEKPVGLVFIALSDGERESCERFHFVGDRNSIREAAVVQALLMLKNW
jgi:nicotinamide-nucleotide amidase